MDAPPDAPLLGEGCRDDAPAFPALLVRTTAPAAAPARATSGSIIAMAQRTIFLVHHGYTERFLWELPPKGKYLSTALHNPRHSLFSPTTHSPTHTLLLLWNVLGHEQASAQALRASCACIVQWHRDGSARLNARRTCYGGVGRASFLAAMEPLLECGGLGDNDKCVASVVPDALDAP